MSEIRHLMSRARALVVFEAAARLESFTKAAAETGLTQSAVSLKIRDLEDWLGVSLFHRSHRRVQLSESGRRLLADVALGLGHIRKSIEEIQAQASNRHVTISASSAFGSYWMLPRLQELRADLPLVDIRIQSSERDLDIAAENIPLGIRIGPISPRWPGYDTVPIAAERIEAVASPAYVAASGLSPEGDDFSAHRLIHLEEPFRPCLDWREWLAATGASASSLPRWSMPGPSAHALLINDYVLVIQAVLEGQGVALGWKHLTDRLVASGLLVRIGTRVVDTGGAIHLIWPKDRALSPASLMVRDWLVEHREWPQGLAA